MLKNPNAAQEVMVTDEILEKLDKGGPQAMLELAKSDPALYQAVDAHLEKLEQAAPEASPEPVIEKAPDEKEVPKGFVPGDKYKKKADEASDFENKWKATLKRLQELEVKKPAEEKTPTPAIEPGKVWTEEHQTGLAVTVAQLQAELAEIKGSRKALDDSERTVLQETLDNADFQLLGADFKEFRTEETLAQMEDRYAKFFYATGATAEDTSPVGKFFSDKAFREGLEAKGVKAPKDFEQLNTILQVKALRDKLKIADPDTKLSDAYAVYMSRNKKLSARLDQARLEGAAQVADRIHNNANETINMSPGSTSGTTANDFSEAQMNEWLNQHPHPKTPTELATFKRIEAYLDEKYKPE